MSRAPLLSRAVLGSRLLHRLLDRTMCRLRFTPPGTWQVVDAPVGYGCGGEQLLVEMPAAGGENWSGTFAAPFPVRVLLDRHWRAGRARLVRPGQPLWREAEHMFHDGFGASRPAAGGGYLAVMLAPPTTRSARITTADLRR
jgi:hypothetical protein